MNKLRSSSLATTSLVLGCLSTLFGALTGIPAVITGHIALGRIKQSAGEVGGRGLAIAGLALGYVGIIWSIGLFVIMIAILRYLSSSVSEPFIKTLF
jgi:hypothetical protein